ncbi:hypothetical protein ABT294_26700 [Nonomuraea sp. NPDC000554]|uniref:hypothetical protein n=1 Tax=Nonomuraea sp. NPDC000554 TaxID=3154259 RepID=UPI0033280857
MNQQEGVAMLRTVLAQPSPRAAAAMRERDWSRLAGGRLRGIRAGGGWRTPRRLR